VLTGDDSMVQTFRVVAWNCRRASRTSHAWDYLLELDPDVALLQDFGKIPASVSQVYSSTEDAAVIETGRPRRFGTGVLVKGTVDADLPMPAPNEWVTQELEILKGNFVAKAVTLHNGFRLNIISVYSPARPIDPLRLQGIDTTGIQLTQNRNVWGTEILWASLSAMNFKADEAFIVGGDFNSSETFDDMWPGGPRGNREFIERMRALGLRDCLRSFKGQLTPTFRNPRGGQVIHQIDHLYATEALLNILRRCDVGSAERVFASVPSLSDHLPIVADFSLDDGSSVSLDV